MKSVTLKMCDEKHHERARHSPNGFDIIEECETCFASWMIKGITGEEIRLPDSYSYRVFVSNKRRSRCL